MFFFHFIPLAAGSERRWLSFMPLYNLFLLFAPPPPPSPQLPAQVLLFGGDVAVSPKEQAHFNRLSCKATTNG